MNELTFERRGLGSKLREWRRLSSMTRRAPFAFRAAIVACVASAAAADPPPEKVAVTGARIIPVVGAEIGKGTVLIERGKIAAVGEKVEIPFDAAIIDAKGKVVFPGMVEAHCFRGMDVANEPRPVTPQLDVYDSIDPSSQIFEDSLRNGITTLHVIHGNNTVIGGVGRVVRPIGLNIAEMTVAEGTALKISVTPRAGYDRMMQMAILRETFAELDDYLEKLAEKRYEEELDKQNKDIDVLPAEARKRGRPMVRAEDVDDKHRNLLRLRGPKEESASPAMPRLGAFVYCGNAMDVGAAVRLAKEHGFFDRLVLVLGGECHKAIGELKAAARPVVLPQELTYREADPITGEISETFVPKKIAEAGLLWAIVPGPDAATGERMLNYQAARCVRNGIARDEAFKAITLNAAKMLGLESRFGSIEKGKDANVVIMSGDPLAFDTVVEKVLIDGILCYEREKDVRLKRLLTSMPSQSGEDVR